MKNLRAEMKKVEEEYNKVVSDTEVLLSSIWWEWGCLKMDSFASIPIPILKDFLLREVVF